MKLSPKERREMEAMVELVKAKLDKVTPSQKLTREETAVINRLCDVRNGLREVLALT